MLGPFSERLIITPWTGIGNTALAAACPGLSGLRGPEALGSEWPELDGPAEAQRFFATHETSALLTSDTLELAGGFGLRAEPEGIWFYYFLLPSHRGKGLSLPALRAVSSHVEQRHAGKPLWAKCAASNGASLRALMGEGFHVVSADEGRILTLSKIST